MSKSASYSHPSISALAKSIRKQLSTEHKSEIKQTQMLKMLAQAKGFKNFQSFVATSSANDFTQQHMILISVNSHISHEVFDRASDGSIIDRRRQTVDRILVTIPVKIRTADSEAYLRILASINSELLPERFTEKPQELITKACIQYFQYSSPNDSLSNLIFTNEVEIVLNDFLDRHSARIIETNYGEWICACSVNQNVYQHLQKQIHKINQANSDFDCAVDTLEDYVRGIDQSHSKETILGCLAYVEKSIEIISEASMGSLYSWNHEKFPGIKRTVIKLVNDEYPPKSELA